jgi:P4 family phage/plasmid primase-like protien
MTQKSQNMSTESKIIPDISDYQGFPDFLSKHIKKKENTDIDITNTRIGDSKLAISGGSYHISDAEYHTFISLYYNDVLSKNKKEYLTEKQRQKNGPLLVDIDLRHTYDTEERYYTNEHMSDMIDLYLEELKTIYQMDEDTAFTVWIFEKPTVNRVQEKNCTKDGIHIIIGLQVDHVVQQIIRNRIVTKINDVWNDIPIINTWDNVFDEGISKGTTNWQLIGSRKPAHERYRLTKAYKITVDSQDNELIMKNIAVSKINMETEIHKLSARYKDHPQLFMRNDFVNEYTQFTETANNNRTSRNQVSPRVMDNQHKIDLLDDILTIASIRNQDELDMMVNNFIEIMGDSTENYHLKTMYDFTMALPEKYYGEGSYDKWKRVGWVLKNTSMKLLIVWIAFSAQSSTFSFSNIPDLCDVWGKYAKRTDGVTKSSLIYWVKTDAPEQYDEILRGTLDYHLEHTINDFSTKDKVPDFDLADVLYHMYKHEYVCVSPKGNIWFRYTNNRWEEIDSGTSLRLSISKTFRALYNKKSRDADSSLSDANTVSNMTQENADKAMAQLKTRTLKILNISNRLANTADKNNIMKEARDLFYDGTFLEKMDTNPYLLCFNNGVIDFKDKCFRKGHPEDIISLCTNINYIKVTSNHQPIVDEINDFMYKLFPDKELCKYMWEHLASTLIGTCNNQTFNMYIGIGSNGKSVLISLMEKILGDYKGDVPSTLVTEKRGKVGGLTPEIVQLKGIRYAVMQEPSKGDVINEGMMKQLTSGKDPIQGRAPYMPKTISFIPQFKLTVACNALMGVKANDHGTWRRIRVVPFKSLFTDKPVTGDKDKPHQFMLDKDIEEKFDEWKEVFASMLVDIVFKTEGDVKDCDIVMAKSNEYRQSQDYIAEFVLDRIIRDKSGCIRQNELNNEFSIWYMSNYGGRGPGPKDLHEHMNKEFGQKQNQVWSGVKIKYENNGLPTITNDTDDSDNEDIIDINSL